MAPRTEFKHMLRIAGQDIDGSKNLLSALLQIKGVGTRLAWAVAKLLDLDPDMRVGFLSEGDVKRIEDVLKDPIKHGLPAWYLNYPRDLEDDKPKQLTGSDLTLKVKSDIRLMQEIKCWRGVRHSLGLKVRGQRTRTTGRTGTTVGVRKRSLR
jgi:small subunit ribosomal protein S13